MFHKTLAGSNLYKLQATKNVMLNRWWNEYNATQLQEETSMHNNLVVRQKHEL